MALPTKISAEEAKKMGWGTNTSAYSPSSKGGLPSTISADQAKSMGWNATPIIGNNTSQNTLTGSDNPVGSLPVIKQLTSFGAGMGSAIGKTLLNIPKAVLQGAQGISNLGSKIGIPKQDYSPAINAIDKFSNSMYQQPVQTELNSTSGGAGQLAGNIAPYALGLGEVNAGLANTASKLAETSKLGKVLPATARVLGGAGAEGLANLGEGYALSGGDTKQALTQGLTAGTLKGGSGLLGEFANAGNLPQKMMANPYKSDKNLVAKIFDESGTASEGNTQPLSKWALDKGLKGSLEAQALQVKGILQASENKVISSAEASKTRIPVDTNLFKMAQKIMTDFKDVGRGEIASKADQFLRAVKNNSVSVKDAINFRRVIDNTLRTKSSFNNPTLADNLSYWAEDLRKAINSTDGIGGINKDYSQAIKAREALIKAATAQGNQKALGALESYALGAGVLTREPLSAAATVGIKRYLQSPQVSRLAQGLKNLPISSTGGATTRSVIGQQLGALNGQ